MPLKKVRENINLLLNKNSNLTTRDILLEHKYKLKDQIDILEKYIYEIDSKLDKIMNKLIKYFKSNNL